MITAEEEAHILTKAYVPEHIVGLMTGISGAEPFLIDSFLLWQKNEWLIMVGYPLDDGFSLKRLEANIEKMKKRFRPRQVSLMAPELPARLIDTCHERESDHYYTLDLIGHNIREGLKNKASQAGESLTIECGAEMGSQHDDLSREFIQRINPPPRVRELFLRIPVYVKQSKSCSVLNAWDWKKSLIAYYVVDFTAKDFSAYITGCHSKINYVKGASDLLFMEMINLSRKYEKKYIHLGLGVNEGLRRFKKKWGGRPARPYEMCDFKIKKPFILDVVSALNRLTPR